MEPTPMATPMASSTSVGTTVRLHSLVGRPALNDRRGIIGKAFDASTGRFGVRVEGESAMIALRPANLVAVPDDATHAPKPAASQNKPLVLQARSGGEWDDLTEQQVQLTMSNAEHTRVATLSAGLQRPPLMAALTLGLKRGQLKVYANPPRYDRLIVVTMNQGSSYVVEAGLDAWEGRAWWTTRDLVEADVAREGLLPLDTAALEAEYGGVLRLFELCKQLDAPRYTIKTDLDPQAKPHVVAMVERVLAASPLRFLLCEEALERADAAS